MRGQDEKVKQLRKTFLLPFCHTGSHHDKRVESCLLAGFYFCPRLSQDLAKEIPQLSLFKVFSHRCKDQPGNGQSDHGRSISRYGKHFKI